MNPFPSERYTGCHGEMIAGITAVLIIVNDAAVLDPQQRKLYELFLTQQETGATSSAGGSHG